MMTTITHGVRARGSREHLHHLSPSENGKPSGLGRTAAHGKHMDEKWSRDVHGRKEEDVFETKGHLSRKDQKIGSAISLVGSPTLRVWERGPTRRVLNQLYALPSRACM